MFRLTSLPERARRAAEHVLAAADAALSFEVEHAVAPAAESPHPHRRAAAVARPARRRGTVPRPVARCLAPEKRRAAPQAARVLR